MVAYTQISGVPVEHLLTAVVISAPGSIMLAKIMVPETDEPETRGTVPKEVGDGDRNIIDAAAAAAERVKATRISSTASCAHSVTPKCRS